MLINGPVLINEHMDTNGPVLASHFNGRFGNERATRLALMPEQRHERERLAETACRARAKVSSQVPGIAGGGVPAIASG